MRKGDVLRFFREVAKDVRTPLKVYVTGGVASWFMGGNRPTEDIDFGFTGKRKGRNDMAQIFGVVSQRLGIAIQFSENISRWGMIEIPHYEKRATFYRRFGKVAVYFLDIGSWSIGKLSRYYASDVSDLVTVLRKQRPDPKKLITGWAAALRTSPRSSGQFLFIKNVEDFLKEYGPKIWGRRFDTEKSIRLFREKLVSRRHRSKR